MSSARNVSEEGLAMQKKLSPRTQHLRTTRTRDTIFYLLKIVRYDI
jgi:hypothetical protein